MDTCKGPINCIRPPRHKLKMVSSEILPVMRPSAQAEEHDAPWLSDEISMYASSRDFPSPVITVKRPVLTV